MNLLLIAAVALLSFANGANDNFKGVATLWGAGRASYQRALAWATIFTFLGSLAAVRAAAGLTAKFNGSTLGGKEVYTQLSFLGAVALAAAGTVLLASRLGLPISTTHALVGAGATAAGFAQLRLAALPQGVVLPLLFSPFAALLLTLGIYPFVPKLAGERDCVCVHETERVALVSADTRASAGTLRAALVANVPSVRWAPAAECQTGAELMRFRLGDGFHWLSAAAISFARGLNDTPKIAAVLLVVPLTGALPTTSNYLLVALGMALGGLLGATRVAQTMSKKITPMATPEAAAANLVAATLVALATPLALPVSATHVTSGSVFGIGLLRRRQADWRRVRDILLSWLGTLPLGAAVAFLFYQLLARWGF